MRLKQIDIVGFKSFPDSVSLIFDRGITAVVGPNGSGKSNIVDAVRWVLGEQSTKSLRGGKMEDVIFSGTSARRATGFAEVSMTIDNSEGKLPTPLTEVKVTRKLYRSGESEYLIAGRNVRLKDVNELFMNTGLGRDGYSLIGQGKISEVLSVKGEERRTIFEEAAGISKYRYRRVESERRLKSAEENLVRLRDILSGYATRVEPLRVQSEKAKKYIELREQRKQLEINVWLDGIEKAREQSGKLKIDFETVSAQLDEMTKAQTMAEEELESIGEETGQINAGLDTAIRRQRGLDAESSESKSKIAVLENDISHNDTRIEELKTGAVSDEALSAKLEAERVELLGQKEKNIRDTQELDEIIFNLETELEEIDEDEAKDHFDELSAQAARLAEGITELRIKEADAKTRLSHLYDERERRAGDGETRASRLTEVEGEIDRLSADLETHRKTRVAAENIVNGHTKRVESRTARLETAESAILELQQEGTKKAERLRLLEGLEQSMEGYSGAVRAVQKAAKESRLAGVHGTVASVISVDKKYATAIETALGAALQNIITETEKDAKSAIAHLREKGAGRATFLPIETIKPRGSTNFSKGDGFVGMADSLVTTDSKYRGIVENLLGRTAIAENLDVGTALARQNGYRVRIVSLDGQVINAGGSLTGGSRATGVGMLSRRGEIDSLRAEIEELRQKHATLKAEKETTATELATAKAGLEAAGAEGRTAKEAEIRIETELAALQKERATLGDEFSWLQSELQKEATKEAAIMAELADIEEQSVKLKEQTEQTEGEISKGKAKIEDMQRLSEDIRAKLTDNRLKAGILRRDMEHTRLAIDNNNEAIRLNSIDADGRAAEIERLRALTAKASGEIAEIKKAEEDYGAKRAELAVLITELTQARDDAELRQQALRKKLRETTEQKEGLVKEHTRLENKLAAARAEVEGAISRLWDEYELTVSGAEELRTHVENMAEAKAKITELRNKIRGLGNINVDAIEEYREVKTQYEFFTEQIGDLEKARGELDGIIEELTAKMKVIFAAQFKVINENFGVCFRDLFGGGSATLELTDPTDVLESGIEIKASPPGKVINNLTSLSGGEQALVAIAMYFAILEVRPSPFVILDEIDTALDEVNVVRLGNYYKKYTDHTQLILVTHRRGAMEAADLLYGVTMQEKGVSKVLRMDVSEAQKMKLN